MSCNRHDQELNVWPRAVEDMIKRDKEGYEKYNRYLRTDCPDDMLQHLYEELLDAAVYTKTLILRRDEDKCKSTNTKTTQS